MIQSKRIPTPSGDVIRYFAVCDYCGKALGPETSIPDALTVKNQKGWVTTPDHKDACRPCFNRRKRKEKSNDKKQSGEMRDPLHADNRC